VIGDNLIVAKIFVTFWGVFQFAAIGIVFSVLIAVLSIFQTGQRATFLLYFSVVPFLVMGWVGLLRGAWIFATLKAPPPSDTGDDAAIRSANIPIDSGSGWPLRPSFTYGKHGASEAANIIVVGALMAAMATFLVLTGTATLLTQILPGLLPQGISARLIRSSADGPVRDGLLLLAFGILTWVGGGVLLWSAWKRFMRTRPLTINQNGIYTFYRGKPWRFMPWGEIKAILKIRADTQARPQTRIQIDGANFTLLITPRLNGFLGACRLVSQYAQDHAIRLQFIDKGRDTIKAQRGHLSQKEYRVISRTGVITDIAAL
jgi:hypothetical protein